MAQTSFDVDRKFDLTLEDLRRHYGAATKGDVLRKAVALLKVAQQNEQPDGSLLIRTGQNRLLKVLMTERS
jgi:hypothetical protein